MRVFSICGRSLDGGSGGADSLLNFLLSRCQGIVRDVQRAFLYFVFDYAVQRCDRVGYFLLVGRISQKLLGARRTSRRLLPIAAIRLAL